MRTKKRSRVLKRNIKTRNTRNTRNTIKTRNTRNTNKRLKGGNKKTRKKRKQKGGAAVVAAVKKATNCIYKRLHSPPLYTSTEISFNFKGCLPYSLSNESTGANSKTKCEASSGGDEVPYIFKIKYEGSYKLNIEITKLESESKIYTLCDFSKGTSKKPLEFIIRLKYKDNKPHLLKYQYFTIYEDTVTFHKSLSLPINIGDVRPGNGSTLAAPSGETETEVQYYKTFINYLFNFCYENEGTILVSSANIVESDPPSKEYMRPSKFGTLAVPNTKIQTYFNECSIPYTETNNHIGENDYCSYLFDKLSPPTATSSGNQPNIPPVYDPSYTLPPKNGLLFIKVNLDI
jgi:hypothetical protein